MCQKCSACFEGDSDSNLPPRLGAQSNCFLSDMCWLNACGADAVARLSLCPVFCCMHAPGGDPYWLAEFLCRCFRDSNARSVAMGPTAR